MIGGDFPYTKALICNGESDPIVRLGYAESLHPSFMRQK